MVRLTLTLVLTLTVATAASAAGPSAATSIFPSFVNTCPRGDIPTTVVVNDAAGIPCVGVPLSMVYLAPCTPPNLCINAGQAFPVDTVLTNAAGVATFNPRIGGCCPGAAIQFVDAVGNVLATIPLGLNSPDLDANCMVDLADLGIFAGFFLGAYNRCADFDWDGALTLADIGVFASHFGH